MSTTHKRPTQEDVAAALMAGAITMEEVARKRRTVQIGDKITLEREVEPDEKSKKKNLHKRKMHGHCKISCIGDPPETAGQEWKEAHMYLPVGRAVHGRPGAEILKTRPPKQRGITSS